MKLVRLRLRDLDPAHRENERRWFTRISPTRLGTASEHELPQVGEADFARFKAKARHFLKAHEDHIVLHKLRQGRPLTSTDLGELEKCCWMRVSAKPETSSELAKRAMDSGGSSDRWSDWTAKL